MTGFFRRALPGAAAARCSSARPCAQDVMIGHIQCVLEKRVSGAVRVLMPADIRFPLERANGVQIVKTAAALAARGRAHDAARAPERPAPDRGDPGPLRRRRRTPACDVRRLRRAAPARARSRCRAPRSCARAMARGAAPRCARGARRVHARPAARGPAAAPARPRRAAWSTRRTRWRRSCTASAARSTAPARRPIRRKARAPAPRARRACGAGRAGFVATTAGIRDSFAAAHGPRARACA